MRKIFTMVMTIIMMVMITGTVSSAVATSGMDSMSIGGATSGEHDQYVEITAGATSVYAVGAFTFHVQYDPSVISANEVTLGAGISGATIIPGTPDNINGDIKFVGMAYPGMQGSGIIAKINFTVVGNAPDSTEISILLTELQDENNQPVVRNPTIINSIFTVTGLPALVITAPDDMIKEANAPSTYVDIGTATTTGGVPPVTVYNDAEPYGYMFVVGGHTVTWTATDSVGNGATDNQKITITDTTKPIIDAPADITEEATGILTNIPLLGNPIVADNSDPFPSVTRNPIGNDFPVGDTDIIWTACDKYSNCNSVTQKITIEDKTSPYILSPVDVTREATGATTFVSNTDLGTPTVSDLVDPSPTITRDPTINDFPVGDTVITWKACDHAVPGPNCNTDTQTVRITVTGGPLVMIAPDDITKQATGISTNVANLGTPGAIGGVPPYLFSHVPPGNDFPIGSNTVIWSVTDNLGNTASDTQEVTITVDPLVITIPVNITIEATGPTTLVSLGTATTTGGVPPINIVNSATPANFAPGIYNVEWIATDAVGTTDIKYQKVTVTDTTPPKITILGINPETINTGHPYTDAGATAEDLVDGDRTAFIIADSTVDNNTNGVYYVNYSVDDTRGNKGTASRVVNVVGYQCIPQPGISQQPINDCTAPTTTISGANEGVSYNTDRTITLTATDNPGGSGVGQTFYTINTGLPVVYAGPFLVNSEGFYSVKYWSSDLVSNIETQKTLNFTIDKTVPSIIAPPNVTVPATGITTFISDTVIGNPTVTDNLDPNPTVGRNPTINNFPVGDTILTWNATDDAGNSQTATQKITVTPQQTTGGTVKGKIFNDLDEDKKLDSGEPGIDKVVVKLTGDEKKNKKFKLSTKSDKNGDYIFSNLPDGKYKVHVETKHGWSHTTSTTKKITMKNGNTIVINFGEKLKKHH